MPDAVVDEGLVVDDADTDDVAIKWSVSGIASSNNQGGSIVEKTPNNGSDQSEETPEECYNACTQECQAVCEY